MSTIKIGNGNTTVNEGVLTGSTLDVDNGNNTVTLLAGSTNDIITIGNGNDTLNADGLSHSTITSGNGNATIHAGTNDTITIGKGADRIIYDGLTPHFTLPASLSVSEEGKIGLPITLGAASLGHEVVIGFRANQDVITLDTSDFAD